MPLQIPEDVPTELWMNIFESMDNPTDLCSVILTCRKFYECGIRSLYRNLRWMDPIAISSGLHAWDESPQLCNDVRSLKFGVSTIPAWYPATFVGARGTVFSSQFMGPPDGRAVHPISMGFFRSGLSQDLFAHGPFYDTILARVATFTNLSRLILKDLLFTDRLYSTIYSLPALRHLHIESCVSPRRQSLTERDPTTLPITELTLLNLRRALVSLAEPMDARHADDDILPILSLGRARNLRTLRVDPTADIFNRVYVVWSHQQGVWAIHPPPDLEVLHLERKGVVRDNGAPQSVSETSFPDRAVYKLLLRCPTIHTLTIAQSLPQHTPYPVNALPNLKNFQGLADTVPIVTRHKQLDAISILHSDTMTKFMDTLGSVAHSQPNLKMLSLECGRWNDELLHAIPQLFPRLRRLHVTYLRGGPTELEVSSWGPLFLSRLPDLHTFQCYEAPHPSGHSDPYMPDPRPSDDPDHPYLFDNTWDSIESEMRDLLIPWNRFCKSLREVQLCRKWKMRRTYDGGRWDAVKVKGDDFEIQETFDY
ncbi:hypothetical protein K474DRAFT_1649839 [Panus rudis PR-1116 ss-1]|nr:hypothetical protein K474DRAFT_1649839 [Panus rudis PR-1116 ss-1]